MKKLILAGLGVCLLTLTFGGWIGEMVSVSATTPEKKTVTIIDYRGKHVKVSCPVERIVTLHPAISEIICAFGDEDKIVGRDFRSNFPPSIRKKPVVAEHPTRPNIEMVLEQKPDVVLIIVPGKPASKLEGLRDKIEAAGIPVIQEMPVDLDRLIPCVLNIGLILDKKEKAQEIIRYIEHYLNLVKERTAKLESQEKTTVFFRTKCNQTISKVSPYHKIVTAAGGINIAAEEPGVSPRVSTEWLLERNPDIIIRKAWEKQEEWKQGELKKLRDSIISEPGLKEMEATREGKVYVIDYRMLLGLQTTIGILHLTKWFYPDLFQDINPKIVHREMLQKFYGIENMEGEFVYP